MTSISSQEVLKHRTTSMIKCTCYDAIHKNKRVAYSVNRGGFLNYLWFLIINFNKLYDVHTFLISKPKY